MHARLTVWLARNGFHFALAVSPAQALVNLFAGAIFSLSRSLTSTNCAAVINNWFVSRAPWKQ